uniref:F7bb6052-b9bd-4f63-936f-a86227ea6985 n=1 Tax=Plasmodiophora brassicae TaxID=37360 RepID=A0A3P3YW86_PLABS|nr:f7bb6052-b9bd-4f63-936f-a86227ea6985 [Plasmodiophora brassicae]
MNSHIETETRFKLLRRAAVWNIGPPANFVPAAAVIRKEQVLFRLTGRKGHVDGSLCVLWVTKEYQGESSYLWRNWRWGAKAWVANRIRDPSSPRQIFRLGSTIARLKLKGIDGDLNKRWNMWFNPMCVSVRVSRRLIVLFSFYSVAWLSSVRVVKCLNLGESLITNKLKVGVTPSRHGPYRLGYTRVTIIITMRSNNVSWSKTLKVILNRWLGWSRNKVVVGEPAAGSKI